MDIGTETVIRVLKGQDSEINATVRRLQELTEENRQAIKKLQQPLKDPAHVHPSR